MMRIYIPTHARAGDQRTYKALPEMWRSQAKLVANERDLHNLRFFHPELREDQLVLHPPEVDSIAKKRAWILRQAEEETIVMMDDDLRFACRVSPEGTALRPCTEDDLAYWLTALHTDLQTHVHAGFGARQGNNRKELVETNARMMYVLGYQVDTVREVCELGRIETREDFDYTLQLLRKGFPNVVRNQICVDQTYNAPGGCSRARTVESSNADAEKLAALHPGLVKVVQKDYAGSVPRKEVVVQWKKAFEHDSRV